jgi:hypothetical protein
MIKKQETLQMTKREISPSPSPAEVSTQDLLLREVTDQLSDIASRLAQLEVQLALLRKQLHDSGSFVDLARRQGV